MKNLTYIIFWIAFSWLMLITETAYAQRHNFYISGAAGYSDIRFSSSQVSTTGGLGSSVGFGYEFNYKSFMMQCGIETHLHNSTLTHDPIKMSFDSTDSEGDFFIANYTLTGNEDKLMFVNMNVPLMLGFRVKNFYFMGGGKLKYNVSSNSTTYSLLNITGTYPEFIEDFENMPDHNFLMSNVTESYKVPLNTNTYLSAEMGLNFKLSEESLNKYRVSLFLDHGLNNLNKPNRTQELIAESDEGSSMFHSMKMNSLLLSKPLNEVMIRDFYSGVRFTMLFGVPDKKPCMCNEYNYVKPKVKNNKKKFKRK